MRIVLLEDNDDDRLLIEGRLKDSMLDCSLFHVSDEKAFKDILRKKHPDLILADMSVPGYDGLSALQYVRNIDESLPFIIVSGTVDHQKAMNLIVEHGASDYVLKDNLDRLISSIARELEAIKIKRTLSSSQAELSYKSEELKKLSAAAKHTNTGLVITDAEGYTEWINASFSRITGYSLDEMRGVKPGYLLQGELTDPDKIAYIGEMLAKAEPFSLEIQNYHKNGNSYWIRLNISPVFNEAGRLTNFIGVQEEISQLKQMEDSLQRSNERLRRAQRVAQVGDWSYDIKSGRIIWSDQMYRIYEVAPEKGPPPYEKIFSLYRNEDGKRLKQAIHNAIEHGQSYRLELELASTEKQKFVLAVGHPQMRGDKVVGLNGIVQDITALKQTEKNAIQAKNDLFDIANNVPGLVLHYVLHPDGSDEVTFVSKGVERLYEVSVEKAIDDPATMWACFPVEEAERLRGVIADSAEQLSDIDEQFSIVGARTGKTKCIRMMSTPFRNEEGGTSWNTVIHDISGLIQTQNQLQQTIAERDVLLLEVHHRVKNNLAILQGLLQLDEFTYGQHPGLTNATQRIKSIALVHELLYQSESISEVDLKVYLESLIAHIKKSMSVNGNIRLNLDVLIDTTNINEAIPIGLLVNELVTNSIKHAFKDSGSGEIQLQIAKLPDNPGKRTLEYRDSGPGFRQASQENTGLGMELITTLIENLNGEYSLNTNGEFHLIVEYTAKLRGAHGYLRH